MIETSASLILSSAIDVRRCEERFLRQKENPDKIPDNALSKFKLNGSKYVLHREDFKKATAEVDAKIKEFGFYLKQQIMNLQQWEIEERVKILQDTFFKEISSISQFILLILRH